MKRIFPVIIGLTASLAATVCAADPVRPNLIIINMDDMGYGDIQPFNPQCKNRTPNLERMAKEGMCLTSFYAAPSCTPSRAQLLTGCYAKRVSLPAVIPPASKYGINAAEHTIGAQLKARGYVTMCIGKWHVGDQPEFLPTQRGFDHYLGIPYSNDMGGELEHGEVKDGKPPLPLLRDGVVQETLKPEDQNLIVSRYTDAAVGFIREQKDKPFFLYLAHTAVHAPIHPGPKFAGKSANGRYGDWVEESDASVGTVLDTLRELKLDSTTLVIFTSDNGPWLPHGSDAGTAGPLRGGKFSTYEGGVREPAVVWWPGHIPAGSTCKAVTGNVDLLPTFVALAGGTVPTDRAIDGKDLSPLLLGTTNDQPDRAWYYFESKNLQAVRQGPWKYAVQRQSEHRVWKERKPEPGEKPAPFTPTLYNLETDIGETTNVADQHPDVVARLKALIATMDADLGANRQGPGVRPAGVVEKPGFLLLKP